jgi:type IV pilus assembly protein PilV
MKNRRFQRIPPGQSRGRSSQTGVALLESLLAILVFSLGILTVIAIQAASVKMAADAQLRTRAVLLADQLVGTMWTSGYEVDDLETHFKTGGDKYREWLTYVQATLPGITVSDTPPDPDEDLDALAAAALQPTVKIDTLALGSQPKKRFATVTITLYWKTPSMKPDEEPRRHIVTTQITRNL